MKDENKTKEQLIKELVQTRQKIAILEARLAKAEEIIGALRGQQVDAIVSEKNILVLRLEEAEEALQRSNEFIETVMNSITDSICTIDIHDFKVTGANETFLETLNMKEKEVIGKTCYALTHRLSEPCGPPDHICPLSETVRTRCPSSAEHVHWDKDGNRKYIEISTYPMTNEKGEVYQVVHVAKDITQRKQAEEALREREKRYRDLYENAPNAYFSISAADGSVLRCNSAALKLLGCDKETITRMKVFDLYADTPHGISKAREILKRFQAGESIRDVELQMKRKDGQPIWISLTVEPLIDQDGNVIESRSMVINISERKRAEEALQKARDELELRVEERTAELKEEIKERKQTAEALRKSEDHLRHLSSQLLTAQENERKRIAMELHDSIGQTLSALKFSMENSLKQMGDNNVKACTEALTTLIPLIQESIEEVRKIAVDLRPSVLDDLGILATISWFCREFQTIYSGIRIEQEIHIQEDEVPEPLKTAIYRVLQEALNNVAKHSSADLACLSLRKTDTTIELAIEDNGLGFNVEEKLSVESSQRGLGLASMKERTELSGGSFAVESVKERGTIIRATWKQ